MDYRLFIALVLAVVACVVFIVDASRKAPTVPWTPIGLAVLAAAVAFWLLDIQIDQGSLG